MTTEHAIVFPPFSLDLSNECLWRESERIILRPKTFAVFRYLVSHAERLVTRDELHTTIWGDTVVSETVLRGCIQEIRAALGDAPKQPQFIETVPRRGYRFLASTTASSQLATHSPVPVTRSEAMPNQHAGQADQARLSHPASYPATSLVGRQAELAQLQDCLQVAQNGRRQVVFVTGEPGIGKTALVETFLSKLMAQEPSVWLGHGQCIEHYGAGEAFGPVLEAFGRLCRGPQAEHVIALLETYAPTWLLQLPALFNAARLEHIRHKTPRTTRERMLREMGEALEALSVEKPVVLVLEDLHWSDASTLDLLSLLARRQEQARVYVIGTYRPAEIYGNGHPLRAVVQELSSHGLCRAMPLPLLNEAAVAQYLHSRLPGELSTDSADTTIQVLSQRIYDRTEGNPLFIINLIDYVLVQDTHTAPRPLPHILALLNSMAQAETCVPVTIRALIDKQLDRLSPQARRVLEAASAAGAEFSTPAVAAGIGVVTPTVEAACRELAQHGQFIHEHGLSEWPDGTIGTHYRFAHALYQEVLYEHVPAAHQVRLHRRIGQAKETAYGQHTATIASELAVHFERGRLFPRAIHYRQQAAENALKRYAPQEASQHLSAALELLRASPPTPERLDQELSLLTALGPVLISTRGWGALEVEQVYTRAQQLCQQLGETSQLFFVLWGLWAFHISKGDTWTARSYVEQLFGLAQDEPNKEGELENDHLVVAYQAIGATVYMAGEFTSAKHYLDQGFALYRPQEHDSFIISYGLDLRVGYLGHQGFTLWSLGYPDQAVRKIEEALWVAHESAHPHSLLMTLTFAASIYLMRGQTDAAREHVETLLALAQTHEFPYFVSHGTVLHGQVLVALGQTEKGIQKIRDGIATHRAEGAQLGLVAGLISLAGAYGQQGQIDAAMKVIDEAFTAARETGELHCESVLYWLNGKLLLQKGNNQPFQTKGWQEEAEGCFHTALELARTQEAKSLELKAATSLSRLWYRQGKNKQARQLLEETYSWFTEGFETRDLQNAKKLLDKLTAENGGDLS